MKVLVTGGAGFIGSHIVEAYLMEGFEVIVVDNLSRGAIGNLPPGARFYRGDIQDAAGLEAVFAKERPDLVNHHAAQIDVHRSVEDPIFDAQCNLLGSLNLLNLCVKYKVSRFIFASTGGAIYGEPDSLPAGEGTPSKPLAPYGLNKATIEQYLSIYHSIHGLQFVVLRYGNVYGPRQNSKGEAGVVAIFCEQMLRGVIPTIFGDGSKTRDYVEVSDVVRANLKALDTGDGEIFNVASGKPVSDYQIFSVVRDALKLQPLEPHYAPFRPGEVNHIFLDVTRAWEKLGWKPKVNLAAGIQRTVDSFKRKVRDLSPPPAGDPSAFDGKSVGTSTA